MATVEVEIDIRDHLDEVSVRDLQAEINSRQRNGSSTAMSVGEVEVWTPSGLADDLRSAFYARNASRFEALLTVLQPHQATAGLHRKRAKEVA